MSGVISGRVLAYSDKSRSSRITPAKN